MGAVKAS